MKKSLIPVIVLVAIAILWFIFRPQKAIGPVDTNQNDSSGDGAESQNANSSKTYAFPGVLPDAQITGKKAIIETDKGSIEIALYGDKAPKTVSNFVYLVDNAFYDGLTFHRVVPGFVVQGGDPSGNGTGGPGYQFADEPVQGDYIKGSVAMANSGPDTNGSQFFICLENQATLPKQYNLFGQVTSGMDIVSQITMGDKIKSIIIEPVSSN